MRRCIAEHLVEYIVEFLGTSALVLTVGCSVLGARPSRHSRSAACWP